MGKGSGKKRIEIKKIEKESSRMVTFSKRRKGLFKKAQQLQSKTAANVAIIVFSPAGRPFTFGDIDSIAAALNTSHTRSHNTADGLELDDDDDDDQGASTSAPSTSTAALNTSHTRHNTADGLELDDDDDDQGASTSAPSTSTSNNKDLKEWVDNFTVECCDEVDELMTLKQQLDFVRSFLS